MYFKYLLSSHVVYVTIWSASRSGLDELVARGVSQLLTDAAAAAAAADGILSASSLCLLLSVFSLFLYVCLCQALPLTALADQKKHSYWLQLRYPSDIYQVLCNSCAVLVVLCRELPVYCAVVCYICELLTYSILICAMLLCNGYVVLCYVCELLTYSV